MKSTLWFVVIFGQKWSICTWRGFQRIHSSGLKLRKFRWQGTEVSFSVLRMISKWWFKCFWWNWWITSMLVSLNEWLKIMIQKSWRNLEKNDRSECKWTIIMFNWPGFGSTLNQKIHSQAETYYQVCLKWSQNWWISQYGNEIITNWPLLTSILQFFA